MKKTAKRIPKIDWSRADAMTAKQRRAAAMADPDNRPMTEREWAAAPRVPQVSVIRRALKLSRPIYRRTAAYGHFGRAPEKDGGFSWERTDLADALRRALK